MKKTLTTVLILFLLCMKIHAQLKFIKASNTNGYGTVLRILPTADNGWVVFSMDSLKLSKFNSCGVSEWSKQYHIPNTSTGLSDFISTQNGSFVLLTRMQNGTIYSALLTGIDAQGNIVWSKSYEDVVYTQFPYTLSVDNQGNIFLFGNVENINNNDYYNMVSKIDANGNLLWTRFYDQGGIWGGAIVTSDNGFLFRTGSNFIKTDNSGNVQWQSQILMASYYYRAAIEVSDGYIFTGYTNSNQKIFFCKMDKSGNPVASACKVSDLTGYPPPLRQTSNGNFTGVFSMPFAGQNFTTLIEFDKNLNVIAQSSINNIGSALSSKEICFTVDQSPVISGTTNGNFFIAKLNSVYQSDCDTAIPVMNLAVNPVTQSFVTTNVFNYNLTTVNQSYAIDTFSILMSPLCFQPKFLELGNDTALCEHETLILQNKNADVFDSYLWSTGDTTPALSVTQPGTYWLHATYNCDENEVADTIVITVTPVTSAKLGDDLYICKDSTEILTAPICASCNYTWSNGSTLSAIEISKAGTYWLSIDNTNGCITSDTIEASIVKCDCSFYVPNAFTPDGDGLNDLFHPVYDCDFNDYSLQIFNRWGQLIYTTKNKEAAWDGGFNNAKVPQGIYLYTTSYQPILKGKLKNPVTKSGTVAVIY